MVDDSKLSIASSQMETLETINTTEMVKKKKSIIVKTSVKAVPTKRKPAKQKAKSSALRKVRKPVSTKYKSC